MIEKRYDAIVVFPFGKGTGSSSTNMALICRAVEEAIWRDIPLIVHEATSMMDEQLNKASQIRSFGGETICEYARNVKEDMAYEIWRNVLVIAAVPIMDRCVRDLGRVCPGSIIFHDGKYLFKDTPYSLWFWAKGAKWYRLWAVARLLFEKLTRLVPWPMYRWLVLPTKKR